MTVLAQAAQALLMSKPDVTALVGSDSLWPSWIFMETPQRPVENSGTCLIVLSQNGSWAQSNDYNTARFPRLIVDIWGDPTRNPDLSMRKPDAKLKIEAVYKAVDKYFHVIHPSVAGGGSLYWGTPEQVANKTGLRIVASKREATDPDYSPTFDNKGGYMGRMIYDVTL